MKEWGGLEVDTIEIHTPRICSVVTPSHSVRIQNRNEFEDKESAENNSPGILGLENKLEKPIEHKLRTSLTRMNASTQENYFLVREFVGTEFRGSVGEEIRQILFTLFGDSEEGANCNELQPSSFQRQANTLSMVVNLILEILGHGAGQQIVGFSGDGGRRRKEVTLTTLTLQIQTIQHPRHFLIREGKREGEVER